ncbi:MAG: ChpI protein [Candidatus Eisenbacteria bacterium]|nr:ChpI protein [Candidatus Eisenbacteria bacterium]
MKTAISIPDTMFEAAERMARRLGISRSQLFQLAVTRFIEEQRKLGVTEALDEVYGDVPSTGRLDPLLSRLQLVSLPREDW